MQLHHFIILQLPIQAVDRRRKAEDDARNGADAPRTEEVVSTFAEEDENAEEDKEVDANA